MPQSINFKNLDKIGFLSVERCPLFHTIYDISESSTFKCAAYMVVADEEFGRIVPFAFLERIKEDFKRRYQGGKADLAVAHSLDKEFGYEDQFDVAYSLDKEFGYAESFRMRYLNKI